MRDSPPGAGIEPAAATAAEASLNVRRSRATRWLYFILGWAFFALGIAGFILPVMPGTVFMILALWSFARSSRRFHAWLFYHPRFGPPLQRWVTHRVVPLWVKLIAWTSMLTSTTYLFVRGDVPWPVLALTVGVVAYAVWFLARCPSRPPDQPQ